MSGGRGSGAGGAAVDVDLLSSGVTPRRRQRTVQTNQGRYQANAARSESQHYMPRQGLFDREQAVSLLHLDSDIDNEDSFDNTEAQEDGANSPPLFDSTELGPYGPSERRPQHHDQPTNWTPTPQFSPVSDSDRNYWTPNRQTLQPINGRPQTDMISLLQQQQGMLKTVLAQQKHMEEQQKLMLEKQHKLEKKLNSLEESTLSSGSDGHKQKARVTRQLTVSNFYFIQFMYICTSSTELGSSRLRCLSR